MSRILSPDSAAPARRIIERIRQNKLGKRWAIFTAGAIFLLSLQAFSQWRDQHAFMINASDSLPNFALWVNLGQIPKKGEVIIFEAPATPMLKTHFDDPIPPFGKKVLGVAGDVVSHVGSRVLINGIVVGRMKARTRLGFSLSQGPTGTIPRGCFYAGTPHPDGFDSRYAEIGFICRDQVIGRGVTVL